MCLQSHLHAISTFSSLFLSQWKDTTLLFNQWKHSMANLLQYQVKKLVVLVSLGSSMNLRGMQTFPCALFPFSPAISGFTQILAIETSFVRSARIFRCQKCRWEYNSSRSLLGWCWGYRSLYNYLESWLIGPPYQTFTLMSVVVILSSPITLKPALTKTELAHLGKLISALQWIFMDVYSFKLKKEVYQHLIWCCCAMGGCFGLATSKFEKSQSKVQWWTFSKTWILDWSNFTDIEGFLNTINFLLSMPFPHQRLISNIASPGKSSIR